MSRALPLLTVCIQGLYIYDSTSLNGCVCVQDTDSCQSVNC